MKTNNIGFNGLAQVFSKKTLYDPNPVRILRNNPIKYMVDSERYSYLEFNCADAIIERTNEKGYVSYTQEQIAHEAGCHVDTVASTEKKMLEDGLLVLRRNYKRSTWGRISSYFKSLKVRKRLSVFLPSLSTVIFVGYSLLQAENLSHSNFLFARTGDNKINNSEDIKYSSNYINQSVSIRSDIHAQGESPPQKRRNVDLAIPKWVKEIQSVHFSLAGQVAVSMFSERIIRAADAKLLKNRGIINDRSRYFFKVCHQLCKEKNIHPDYNFAKDLHDLMGTDEAMPMVITQGKNPDSLIKLPAAFLQKQPMKTAVPHALYDNPFTEYYQTLTDEEQKRYDNDPPPVFHGEFGKKTYYRHATPEELAARQKAFIQVPLSQDIVNFLPLGYAERVFANLRFIEIKE